ncbi:MAG: DNA mismatch endonuclease Vsr, partial [Planctomycetota bacterium]
MTDFLTQDERSALMKKVRPTGTEPEQVLLKALHRLGARPTKNAGDLPGKPDVVFKADKLACFVDGELWHGAQWRRRGLDYLDQQFSGASDRAYWVKKVQGNVRRDLRRTGDLLEAGWRVVRFWAKDVLDDPEGCAQRLMDIRAGRENTDALSYAAAATSADFFAGIGLMSLGLQNAGWRTVWANDYDASKNRLFE